MIPPVNKDNVQDEDVVPSRPEWMKWYYDRWAEATVYFDPEQKGWYMNLLMYAASQGRPPGYLKKDESKLQQIAGFTDVPQDVLNCLSKDVNGNTQAYIEQIRSLRLQKWMAVRAKFLDSNKVNGYVYNRRLVETLREAYEQLETRRIAGLRGAQTRWRTRSKQTKEVTPSLGDLFKEELQNAPLEDEHALPLSLLEAGDLMANPQAYEGVTDGSTNAFANGSAIFNSDKNVLGPTDTTNRTDGSAISTDPVINSNNTVTKSTKLVRRNTKKETLFDDDKFKITMEMYEHLKKKFPEFEQGDFDYLEEKFRNNKYGTSYKSWKRTFYNFVTNQVVLYGYKPGAFNWRKEKPLTPPPVTGASQYESAAGRADRLEREADEHSRRLRGGSHGDSTVGEEALPLTSDDD